jgi:hypothetical protein
VIAERSFVADLLLTEVLQLTGRTKLVSLNYYVR